MKKTIAIVVLLLSISPIFAQDGINEYLNRNRFMHSRNCNSQETHTTEYKLKSISNKIDIFVCKVKTTDNNMCLLKLSKKFELPKQTKNLSKKEKEERALLFKRIKADREYECHFFLNETDINNILSFIEKNKAAQQKPIIQGAYSESSIITINNNLNIGIKKTENSTKWSIFRSYGSISSNSIYSGDIQPLEDMLKEAVNKIKQLKQ